jgi:hypothetical protein
MTDARAATNTRASARLDAREFLRRVEAGDAAIFLYVAAFVREYFWIVSNVALAWTLTAACASLVTYLYVATREERERAPAQFWYVVALPLLFIYALRAPFPDLSFDVFNYRLLHSERALRGVFFISGDWFPTPAPYNPAPDIATGITRYLLGYRLGTAINLLAIIWAAQIVERLLRPYVRGAWRRSACVLLVVLAEHVLFEINEYMVDVLAVPVILEAIYLAARPSDAERTRVDTIRAAFLLGIGATFKLTNLSVVVPVAILFARKLLRQRAGVRALALTATLAVAAFLVSLAPFSVYMYRLTGSPVFPVYNAVFKSSYGKVQNFHDGRWGPDSAAETLVWPLVSAFEPERLSELKVYSGRIAFGFVFALAGLVLARRDGQTRTLCFIFVLDALLWSATTGYIRYALHLELLAGALVVCLAAKLAHGARDRWRQPKLALAALAFVLLAAQATLAFIYVLRTEWGGRPTLVQQPRSYGRESKLFLRDRSLVAFLPDEERSLVAGVGVWVWSGMKAPGIEAALRPDLPIIGVRQDDYFASEEARRGYADALARAEGKSMWSLCIPVDMDVCRSTAADHGLKVVREIPFMLPYYSPYRKVDMRLVELTRADATPRATR